MQVADKGERPGSQPVIGLEIMAEQLDSLQPPTSTSLVEQPTGLVKQPTGLVEQPTSLVKQPTGLVEEPTSLVKQLDTKIHIDTNQDTFPGKKQSLYIGDELSTGDEREIVAESGDNQEDYDQEEEILTSRELELLCEDIAVTLKSDSDLLAEMVFSLWSRSRASETHMLRAVQRVAERVLPRVHTDKLGSRAGRYFIVSLKNELKVVGWL